MGFQKNIAHLRRKFEIKIEIVSAFASKVFIEN